MFLLRVWFNVVTAPLWVPPWLTMAGLKFLAEHAPYSDDNQSHD